MSYSVAFLDASDPTTDEVFFLCNLGAWTDFVAWVRGLGADYDVLAKFVRDGELEGTDVLSAELLDAEELRPPPEDSNIEAVLTSLIEFIGVGDEDETIRLTDEVVSLDEEGEDELTGNAGNCGIGSEGFSKGNTCAAGGGGGGGTKVSAGDKVSWTFGEKTTGGWSVKEVRGDGMVVIEKGGTTKVAKESSVAKAEPKAGAKEPPKPVSKTDDKPAAKPEPEKKADSKPEPKQDAKTDQPKGGPKTKADIEAGFAKAAKNGLADTNDVFTQKEVHIVDLPDKVRASAERAYGVEGVGGQGAHGRIRASFDDIIPTQDYVGVDKTKGIAKDFKKGEANVQFVHYKGKLYVYDGHHTAVASALAGNREIEGQVVYVK